MLASIPQYARIKEMKSNINTFIKLTVVSLAIVLVAPVVAMAAPTTNTTTQTQAAGSSASGCATNFVFPAWYEGLCDSEGNIKSPADMGKGKDTAGNLGAWLTTIALNIVQILLYVVGYVSIGFIIYGGFKYMTQGDNASGTAAARKTIMNAVIGLAISIMSVAIVKFVAGSIGG